MTYGDMIKRICKKMRINIDSLPDRLYGTLLSAIDEKVSVDSGYAEETVTLAKDDPEGTIYVAACSIDIADVQDDAPCTVFINGVEYEGWMYRFEDNWGIEVDGGDFVFSVTDSIYEGEQEGCAYIFLEPPENSPETITLHIEIMKK